MARDIVAREQRSFDKDGVPLQPGDVLTLLVASEVRFLRESLGEVLGRVPAFSVIGFGADAEQILALSQDLRPDMVLLDASMRNGPAAVRRLRQARPGLLVVAFAVSESVESVLVWAEAGAGGYIPNTAAMTDLHALLQDIRAGRQPCSPPVAAGLLRRVAKAAEDRVDPAGAPLPLTQREMEIVRLISAGCSNKDIARQLNIGLATTKSHVHNVLGKLNVQRRGQVARWMHGGPPSLVGQIPPSSPS